jgi:hypothetical protein
MSEMKGAHGSPPVAPTVPFAALPGEHDAVLSIARSARFLHGEELSEIATPSWLANAWACAPGTPCMAFTSVRNWER